MTPFGKKRRGKTSLLIAVVLVTSAVGCGEDFENEPREPVPIELTGVIKPARLEVAPAKVGAGPISITISNQTGAAQTVTLEGNSVREEVGPINPADTATIQKTVRQGTYEVRAAAGTGGGANAIRPGSIKVGPPRRSSNERVLLP